MKKKILPHDKERLEQFAIEGLVKGYASSELILLCQQEFPSLEQEDFESALRRAHITIKETTLTDIDKIIPYHIELYERIYKEFNDDLYFLPGKLRALRQKEALTGLHKEQNFVEIHNTLDIEIEKEAEYDLTKLDDKEQKRLGDLMKRAISSNE